MELNNEKPIKSYSLKIQSLCQLIKIELETDINIFIDIFDELLNDKEKLINQINIKLKNEFKESYENADIERLKFILKIVNQINININININEIFNEGNYPLLIVYDKNNIELAQLIIDYASKNNVILKINEKNKDGNYPLLIACDKDDIELAQLTIDYSIKNNITIQINEKNKDGNYPLKAAIKNKNIEIINLLLKYLILKHNDWELNNNNEDMISLLYSFNTSNENLFKQIIDHDGDVNKEN